MPARFTLPTSSLSIPASSLLARMVPPVSFSDGQREMILIAAASLARKRRYLCPARRPPLPAAPRMLIEIPPPPPMSRMPIDGYGGAVLIFRQAKTSVAFTREYDRSWTWLVHIAFCEPIRMFGFYRAQCCGALRSCCCGLRIR